MRLIFELTQLCNMQCRYCKADKSDESLSIDVLEKVCNVIHARNRIDYITLTGGEPLLYRHLDKAIAICNKYTSNILLLSNGLLIDGKEIINLLCKYDVEVQISLDSIATPYHDKFRGNQKRIIDNILKLKKSTDLEIGIVCVISRGNILEIPRLIEFCEKYEMGLDFELIDVDFCSELSLEHLTREDVLEMLKFLKPWGRNENNKMKYHLFKLSLQRNKYKPSICIGSRNTIVIHSDGTLSNCFHNKEIRYGNSMHSLSIYHALEGMKKKRDLNCFSHRCIGDFF